MSTSTRHSDSSERPGKSILKHTTTSAHTDTNTTDTTATIMSNNDSTSSHTPINIDTSLNNNNTSNTIRWDEQNLQLNDSEKIPRQKITEPKTPYHPPRTGTIHHSQASGTGSDIDSMSEMQLDGNDDTQSMNPVDVDTDDNETENAFECVTVSGADIGAKPVDEAKEAAFQSKRHEFYKNEYTRIKQALQSDQSTDDDTDEITRSDVQNDLSSIPQHVNKRAKS